MLAQMVKNEGSLIPGFYTGYYVIDPCDHENRLRNFIRDEEIRILEIFEKKNFSDFSLEFGFIHL